MQRRLLFISGASMIVRCPTCSKATGVPDDAGGKRARCPFCQQIFQVSATPSPPVAAPVIAVVEEEIPYAEEDIPEAEEAIPTVRAAPRQVRRGAAKHFLSKAAG